MSEVLRLDFEDPSAERFGFSGANMSGTWENAASRSTSIVATGGGALRWEGQNELAFLSQSFSPTLDEIYFGFHLYVGSSTDIPLGGGEPVITFMRDTNAARLAFINVVRMQSGSGPLTRMDFRHYYDGGELSITTPFTVEDHHERWLWVGMHLWHEDGGEFGDTVGMEVRLNGEVVGADTTEEVASRFPCPTLRLPVNNENSTGRVVLYYDNIIVRTDTWPTEPTDDLVRLPQYIYGSGR